MADTQLAPKTTADKLLSIPKPILYLLLILATAVPLFIPLSIPNKPKQESIDMFEALSTLGPDDVVVIQSDWTESTRGENGGLMDAMLRIVMRQRAKFAICSVADPQGPQVARNSVNSVNLDFDDDKKYKKWDDWVELGFYPNAEGLGKSISTDIRKAFGNARDSGPGMPLKPVFESPVLSKIKKIEDVKMYIIVTGTKSINIAIERFAKQTRMTGMVTGVMGPETLNYYLSGQLKGLSVGLKGVVDLEGQMEDKYPGKRNLDKGPRYILSLHVAIGLLIGLIIVGNIGVLMQRRRPA